MHSDAPSAIVRSADLSVPGQHGTPAMPAWAAKPGQAVRGPFSFKPRSDFLGGVGLVARTQSQGDPAPAPAAAALVTQQASANDSVGMAAMMSMAAMPMGDHEAALALVPLDGVSATAVQSGNWSDPEVWLDRRVPGPQDRVWIMADRAVTVDSDSIAPVNTVRVSGTLRFAPDRNTRLEVDTIVVDHSGSLIMGTATEPIGVAYTASMIFSGAGPIDLARDPGQLGRGLISMGNTQVHGAAVTSWLAAAVAPKAGDTALTLTSVPIGWKAGDTIVLAGTQYTGTGETQDERLVIASVDGPTVRLRTSLRYDHAVPTNESLAAKYGQAPSGAPLAVHVANLTRNVQFASAKTGVIGDRGHVMLMDPMADIANAGFYGLGRTDKSIPISSTNVRGRYALHFHLIGTSAPPIQVRGVAVDGSPGWGVVNHGSNVDVADSVVYGAVGAAFASEIGNEVGSFRNNMAIKSVGPPTNQPDIYHARDSIQDYGYAGHGFWIQSPTVAMSGNVVSGAASFAIVYYPLGYGGAPTNLENVPIAASADNTMYASRRGFRIYASNPTTATNVIGGLTAWNLRYEAFGTDYSSNVSVIGGRFIGQVGGNAGAVYLDSGSRFSFRDAYVVGFDVGLDAGYGGRNEISGGFLNNGVDLRIVKNTDQMNTMRGGLREVAISGVRFAGGGIKMEGGMPSGDNNHPFYTAFDPELITWDGRQIYYADQSAATVIRAPMSAIDGKTNAQLQSLYGLAYAGAVMPSDAARVAKLTGGMLGSSRSPQPGALSYVTTYAKDGGRSELVFFNPYTQSYASTIVNTADIRTGWNLFQFVDGKGIRRRGFIRKG